mgnify:CR=1 FL=1
MIRIQEVDGYLHAYTPFSSQFVAAIKQVPGRIVISDKNGPINPKTGFRPFKCWAVPVSQVHLLGALCVAHYPMMPVLIQYTPEAPPQSLRADMKYAEHFGFKPKVDLVLTNDQVQPKGPKLKKPDLIIKLPGTPEGNAAALAAFGINTHSQATTTEWSAGCVTPAGQKEDDSWAVSAFAAKRAASAVVQAEKEPVKEIDEIAEIIIGLWD